MCVFAEDGCHFGGVLDGSSCGCLILNTAWVRVYFLKWEMK